MEVWVTGQPHLLYETVELLFAYVNRIPAVELTQEGPYCLPEAGNPADAGCGLRRYFPG